MNNLENTVTARATIIAMRQSGNNDPAHNTTPLNDDTRNDTDSVTVRSSPATRWLAVAVIALLAGWGLRNWTAQNSPQPLPFGPIVDNQVSANSAGSPAEGDTPEPNDETLNNVASNGTAPAQEQAATSPASSNTIMVHVAGHVANPGVYALPPNARVQDAIERAGGVSADGDADSINQAAWVRDGQRIEVAAKAAATGTASSAIAGASQASSPTAAGATAGKRTLDDLTQNPVDLNTASVGELTALPDIGPGMAARIIAYREQHNGFHSVADLDRVPGIGQKRLETLRPLVTAH